MTPTSTPMPTLTSTPATRPRQPRRLLLLLMTAALAFSSLWTLGTSSDVQQQTNGDVYVDAGLGGKTFPGSVAFRGPAVSVLACSVRCSERQGCVAFTFQPGKGCTGHSVRVTSESASEPAAGAVTFLLEEESASGPDIPSCEKTGVKRLDYPSLGIDLDVSCNDDWIVFQRRTNDSLRFDKDYQSYVDGFGDITGNFWMGLDALHNLTSAYQYELRIEFTSWDDDHDWEAYGLFSVGSREVDYNLTVASPSSSIGEAYLEEAQGIGFSTEDVNNSPDFISPAIDLKGGWWYKGFTINTNPHGIYYLSATVKNDAFRWGGISNGNSLKAVEMKIRPAK